MHRSLESAVHNLDQHPREAMWVHHPAFGAPLISGACRIDCGASSFVADDERDAEHGDLQPGAESAWPYALARDGRQADLRVVPPDGAPVDRFGYLTGFAPRETGGWATLTNGEIGLRVRLAWEAAVFPCAWYWLEARATPGYPWFGDAYVLAIEPASTWPGQGIAASRRKGNGPTTFAPGETRTATTVVSVTSGFAAGPSEAPVRLR